MHTIARLTPLMVQIPDLQCELCLTTLYMGHTAYTIRTMSGRWSLACWNCGEAMALELGITTPDTTPMNPPFGGGPPHTRTLPANSR